MSWKNIQTVMILTEPVSEIKYEMMFITITSRMGNISNNNKIKIITSLFLMVVIVACLFYCSK